MELSCKIARRKIFTLSIIRYGEHDDADSAGLVVAGVYVAYGSISQEATVKEVHDAPAVRGSIIPICCRSMTIRSRSILMTPTTHLHPNQRSE